MDYFDQLFAFILPIIRFSILHFAFRLHFHFDSSTDFGQMEDYEYFHCHFEYCFVNSQSLVDVVGYHVCFVTERVQGLQSRSIHFLPRIH